MLKKHVLRYGTNLQKTQAFYFPVEGSVHDDSLLLWRPEPQQPETIEACGSSVGMRQSLLRPSN